MYTGNNRRLCKGMAKNDSRAHVRPATYREINLSLVDSSGGYKMTTSEPKKRKRRANKLFKKYIPAFLTFENKPIHASRSYMR